MGKSEFKASGNGVVAITFTLLAMTATGLAFATSRTAGARAGLGTREHTPIRATPAMALPRIAPPLISSSTAPRRGNPPVPVSPAW